LFDLSFIRQDLEKHWKWGPLHLEISAKWSSIQVGYREELRLEMLKEVRKTSWGESVDKLLVPGQLGELQRGFFSISHCPLAGGYVLQEAPLVGCSIGFDLEQASRVSPEIVNRISSPSEFRDSPDPASLWTAKESLYKSLPDVVQPSAISGVRVFDWSALGDNLYSFSGLISSAQHFHNSHGLLWTINDLKMGLCLSWI
jgi:hypothetical protein